MEASLPPAMAVDLMDTSLERDQQILMLIWAMVLVLLLIHLGEALLAQLSMAIHHSAMGMDVPSMARGLQMLRLTLNLPLMVRDLLNPMELLVMFMVWELLGTLDMLPAMLEEPSMAILHFIGLDLSMEKGPLNQKLIPTMVAMDMPMVFLVGILMCPDLLLTDTDVNITPTPERAVM